jgi:phosphopantothenoylcysteine decarboxylase/phosphopantothenate--cysteine ligase
MAEPEDIVQAAEELLAGTGPLRGKRVLVSAGGTREPIDAVRFVGNRSSGRMGVALAAEARRRGARVTLLGANLAVPSPPGVELVETPTASELESEVLSRGVEADVVIMAAAVADYRPAEALATKRPKDRSGWTVELEPTTDVLAALGERRAPGQLLVGFAADQGEGGLERARDKLTNKKADLFVFNDVSRTDIGFDAARRTRRADNREGAEGGDRSRDSRRGGAPAWLSRRSLPNPRISSPRSSRISAASSMHLRRRCAASCSASSPRDI